MDPKIKPAGPPRSEGINALKRVLRSFSERIGWEAMGVAVPIRCFTHDPSIKSSSEVFTQDAVGARQVESLYLKTDGSLETKLPLSPLQWGRERSEGAMG